MNHLDEPRIAELAMKAAARQLTPAEQAEVDALQAGEPAGRRKFEQRLAEAKVLAEAAALLNATESQAGELPGYARERLRAKVRQTYGAPVVPKSQPASLWKAWRFLLVGASGAAVIAVVALLFSVQGPVVQVALLDPVGVTRGGTNTDLAALREAWPTQTVSEFRTEAELASWNQSQAGGAKDRAVIVFDRAAGEVRVTGRRKGTDFAKVFTVETDLKRTLVEAQRYVQEQLR